MRTKRARRRTRGGDGADGAGPVMSCLNASIPPPLMELGDEQVHMHVEGYGSIVLGFFPNAAPVTVEHILKLFRLGCYDSDHIFRVDKGFVAQVQSVYQGAVEKPLSEECLEESKKTVPAEFTPVRHVRGILSMGRMSDPNSGGSSFSMLLGRAAHLDRWKVGTTGVEHVRVGLAYCPQAPDPNYRKRRPEPEHSSDRWRC